MTAGTQPLGRRGVRISGQDSQDSQDMQPGHASQAKVNSMESRPAGATEKI